jgi:hypothetical protein
LNGVVADFLVLAITPQNTTHSGDGTRVTAAADTSGRGNNLIEGSAGFGPVYRADIGGQPCLEYFDGWLKGAGQSLLSVANGLEREYTVLMVVRVRSKLSSTTTHWAWARANSVWHALRTTEAAALAPTFLQNTDSGAKPTITSSDAVHGCWSVVTLRRKARTVQIRIDGVTQSEQASALDAITVAGFAIGAIPTTTPSIGGDQEVRELRVYGEGPSDADIAAVERELAAANGLSWKAQLGASIASPLVYVMAGQSNTEGQGDPPHTVVTAANAYMLALDGQLRTFSEPSHDGRNQSTGQIAHDDPHLLGSYGGAFVNRVRTRTAAPIIVVPVAKASTTSTTWATAGTVLNTLLSTAKHRLREALKASGAKIGAFIYYQGESNSSNLTEADQWLTDVRAIFDELEAEFSASFATSIHFVLVRLPSIPYVSSDAASWARVRTHAQTIIDERADTIGVDSPNTVTPYLHLRTVELEALGVLLGDAVPV